MILEILKTFIFIKIIYSQMSFLPSVISNHLKHIQRDQLVKMPRRQSSPSLN